MRTRTPPSETRPAWPASTLKAATWRWSLLHTETWPSAPALAQHSPLPAGTSMTWVSLIKENDYFLYEPCCFIIFLSFSTKAANTVLVRCFHMETSFAFIFSLVRKTNCIVISIGRHIQGLLIFFVKSLLNKCCST